MSWEIITSLAKKNLHKYSRRYFCEMPKTKVDFSKLNPIELRPLENATTFRTESGDFYTFIQDEYDSGMFKHLKDFFEGKINSDQLKELIIKYKKPSQKEELSLVGRKKGISWSYVSYDYDYCADKELIAKYEPSMLKNPEYWTRILFYIDRAKNGDIRAQAILRDMAKNGGFDAQSEEYIYRYIGESELEKILSGEIVEAGKGGYASAAEAFDVMTPDDAAFAPYRVKFRLPISTEDITYHKGHYYHYHTPSYNSYDAATITEATGYNIGKVLHTSPIETVKNFIDKFIKPLERYSPKQKLFLSEDKVFEYLETPVGAILSSKELEMLVGNNQIKDIPLKHVVNCLKNDNPVIREQSTKILDFLKQKYNIDFSVAPDMYRFVGQAEKDLVASGKTVKSGFGGLNSCDDCFDVTTDPYLDFNYYRLRLNRKLGDKDVAYHRHKTYYHLQKAEYEQADVKSIDSVLPDGYFRVWG